MSLRDQQYRALTRTRAFLGDLLNHKKTPRVPKDIRKTAGSCVKHFPVLDEHGKPYFSSDPFGPDEPPVKGHTTWECSECGCQHTHPPHAASEGCPVEK